MTVASAVYRVDYTGNGATSSYSYTFKILSSADISVYTLSGTTETHLALTTGFTVSGAGVATGGTISLVNGPLASGSKLVILRGPSILQSTALSGQRQFFGSSVEAGLDRLAMIEQMINEAVGRCIKFPTTDSTALTATLPVAASRASAYLVCDASGNITTTPTPSSISGLTAGSILFAGSNGFPTQNNASLFWDSVNATLRVGSAHAIPTGQQYLQFPNLDATVGGSFGIYGGWFANTNPGHNRDDSQMFVGYNVNVTGGPAYNAAEPQWFYALESYETTSDPGVPYTEGHLSFIGTTGNLRRPWSCRVNRTTELSVVTIGSDNTILKDSTQTNIAASFVITNGSANSHHVGIGGVCNNNVQFSAYGAHLFRPISATVDNSFWVVDYGAGSVWNLRAVNDAFSTTTYALSFARSGSTLTAGGVNTSSPRRMWDVLDSTNPQLRLTQADNTVYTEFQTDSSGNTIISNTGATTKILNSTTAQIFNVYNSFVAATSSEFFTINWAANLCTLQTNATGSGTNRNLNINAAGGTITFLSSGSTQVKIGNNTLSFFNSALVAKQTRGATFTNNITSGGTTDSPANWTDLTTYANDAAAIRNFCYQMARAMNQHDVALRNYGLLT